MRALTVIWIIVQINAFAFGQDALTYHKVDSTSFKLYEMEDWRSLARYGKKVSRQGYDYYYLNLRTGIADYNLSRWYSAEKYLLKAYRNNSSGNAAKEFLYWNYLNTGDQFSAREMYALLDTPVTRYHAANIVDALYLEGGHKWSDDPANVGHIMYGNLGVGQNLGKKARVFESATYLTQQNVWGSFKQYQVYVSSSWYLGNRYVVDGGFHGMFYRSILEYNDVYSFTLQRDSASYNFREDWVYDHTWQGKYDFNVWMAYAGIIKTKGRFTISPKLALFTKYVYPAYDVMSSYKLLFTVSEGSSTLSQNTYMFYDTIPYTQSIKHTFIQPGLWTTYVLPVFSDRLEVGVRGHILVNDSVPYAVIPAVTFRIRNGLWLSGYGFEKQPVMIADHQPMIMLHASEEIKSRISVSCIAEIKKLGKVILTYQNENLKDEMLQSNYSLQSVFLGFRKKL